MNDVTSKSYIVNKYFTEIERVLEGNQSSHGDVSRHSSRLSLLFSTEHQVHYGGRTSSTRDTNNNNGRARCVSTSSSSGNLALMEDLIHIQGPLTEDAILRVLQARFYKAMYYTYVGPILLVLNPFHSRPSTRALDHAVPQYLQKVVNSAMVQLQDSRCSQSIVLNGISGSGKTHTSMLLLRQLFDVAGGGNETDAFKHINASLTVLRSLSSASTVLNKEASRMGFFIENYISDGAIHKTKMHCITIDQTRVSNVPANEKNYHIFYQVLAGLSPEEMIKYHLQGQNPNTLDYLNRGPVEHNLHQDKSRFDVWKACLLILGIPVHDILRMISAVMLLGNVKFVEGQSLNLEVNGDEELKSVAALLGLSESTLYKSLTMRSQQTRGQVYRTVTDQLSANQHRDSLARALYMRTLNAVIKRANSSRRPNHSFSPSNSSTESNGQDLHSPQMPGHGSMKSMSHSRGSAMSHTIKANSVGDSFIAVLDMMGFEDLKRNELEQLCLNLTAETLQHFYNTHIFKSTEEACIEEGIQCDIDINYHENAPVVELISSQRTGILSLLDGESGNARGNVDTYMQRVRIQHSMNPLFSDTTNHDFKCFTICHYVGKITYVTENFTRTNQDRLGDDVIWMFSKQNCSFGFVTHLFSHELKLLQEHGSCPSGKQFRCFPHTPADINEDNQGTLSLDFHTKLDNLLKTLVQTSPHFIRCIKSNAQAESEQFQRECVVQQLRSLQVLETLHLMAAGFPHRYRYRSFNARYRVLVRPSLLPTDQAYTQTKVILDSFLRLVDESMLPYASANWALGKKHIFLSESARQQFDALRDEVLYEAATLIQAQFRRFMCVRLWPALRRQLELSKRQSAPALPSKQPTRKNGMSNHHKLPPPLPPEKRKIDRTLEMYKLSMNEPPPVPPARPYTVKDNVKVSFPQYRLMKQDYRDLTGTQLLTGQRIQIIGFAQKRGFLTVDLGHAHMDVPNQLTEVWEPSKSKIYADV